MAASSVRMRWNRALLSARLLRGASRGARKELVGRHLLSPMKRRAAEAVRFALVRQTRVVDVLFGQGAGNRFFWRSPSIPKTWDHVERRLFLLQRHGAGPVGQFVALALDHSDDFIVLSNLARSAITKRALAARLATAEIAERSAIGARVGTSHAFAAAIVGAARLLLDPDGAERIERDVARLLPGQTEGYLSLVDSLGARPAMPPQSEFGRGLSASGFRAPVRRRLVIADNLADRQSLSLLFDGAEEVTLYAMNDLYGKADFAGVPLHSASAAVTVEHSRSRITRFSADYHDLHGSTRRAAEMVVGRIVEAAGDSPIIPAAIRPFAELAIADRLFFPTLLVAAVRKLLADDSFDHVVIALGAGRAGEGLCRQLAILDEIRTDPRIEAVSVSRRLSDRVGFANAFRCLLAPPAPAVRAGYWGPSVDNILRWFDQAARDLAPEILPWAGDGRRRLLFLSAPSRAYNRASWAYRNALATHHDVHMAFMGRNFLPLLEADDAAAIAPEEAIQLIPVALTPQRLRRFLPLRTWLDSVVAACADEMGEGLEARFLRLRDDQFTVDTLTFIAAARRHDHWFRRMAEEGQLPDAVILSPYREAAVAAFSAIARAHGVPSIAFEPHVLNGNYCRYVMIHADHYGVMTSFFRDEAVADFGIPAERCHVVGSPRLTAPAEYDLAARTATARKAATAAHGITFRNGIVQLAFFSQPLNWSEMSAVWRILLQAAGPGETDILLKVHPEETPTRTAQYLDLAAALGLADRVILWPGDAKEAVECADLVLSAYSTTIIEAATLRRPAVCIANGDTDYPLDQHRVIGAPLVRSAAELAGLLDAFRRDPAPLRAAAADFVRREPQLTEDLAKTLQRTIDSVLAAPQDVSIRKTEDLPASCFLTGPHRTFDV